MKLTLIRHGNTLGNIRRLYYGRTELPLLDESISELRRAAEKGGYPTASRYYTSGMLRAEQSLLALYGPVEHSVIADLREIDFGDFEMKSYEELRLLPAYIAWISGDNEANICPNGESGRQVTARALKALEAVIAHDEDAVVITHGGVIGGVMDSYFPNRGGRYSFTPAPGSGFQIEFANGVPTAFSAVPFKSR